MKEQQASVLAQLLAVENKSDETTKLIEDFCRAFPTEIYFTIGVLEARPMPVLDFAAMISSTLHWNGSAAVFFGMAVQRLGFITFDSAPNPMDRKLVATKAGTHALHAYISGLDETLQKEILTLINTIHEVLAEDKSAS